jgi:hypothetical protein
MMTRRLRALPAAILAAGLFGKSTLAQTPLSESPITPGFWSFPNHRPITEQQVIAACRNHFQIRFADGHFIGLKVHKTEGNLVRLEIDDVGRCAFNHEAQIDTCDVKLIHSDGSILVGTTESRYSFDAHTTLKMIVTPKMITDTPFSDAPFDAFPVRCPDGNVWSILNEIGQAK